MLGLYQKVPVVRLKTKTNHPVHLAQARGRTKLKAFMRLPVRTTALCAPARRSINLYRRSINLLHRPSISLQRHREEQDKVSALPNDRRCSLENSLYALASAFTNACIQDGFRCSSGDAGMLQLEDPESPRIMDAFNARFPHSTSDTHVRGKIKCPITGAELNMQMLPGVIASSLLAVGGGTFDLGIMSSGGAETFAFEQAVLQTTMASASPFSVGQCIAQYGLPPGVEAAPPLTDHHSSHSRQVTSPSLHEPATSAQFRMAERFVADMTGALRKGDSLPDALRRVSLGMSRSEMKDVVVGLATLSDTSQDFAVCMAEPPEVFEQVEKPTVTNEGRSAAAREARVVEASPLDSMALRSNPNRRSNDVQNIRREGDMMPA